MRIRPALAPTRRAPTIRTSPDWCRADETWVKIISSPTYNQDNAAVYAAYLANFNAMWASTPTC